jgi:hypothetical protein
VPQVSAELDQLARQHHGGNDRAGSSPDQNCVDG